MKISIRYFAALRDQRGIASEQIDSDALRLSDLFNELRILHKFQLTANQIRFAVNNQYVEPDSLLSDGDHVVFIPPVAGG